VFVACVFPAGLLGAAVLRAGEDGGAGAGRRASMTGAETGFDRDGAGGVVPTVGAAGAAPSAAGLALSRGSSAAGADAVTVASVSWTAGEAAVGAFWAAGAAAADPAELLRTAT
jgi:hypothetical protein